MSQLRKSILFFFIIFSFIGVSLEGTSMITPNHEFTVEILNSETLFFKLRNIGGIKGWVGIGFGGHLMEKVDYHIF